MTNKARVFISYKTGPDTGLTFQANIVREKLREADYDVWWDVESLQAGLDWNTQIYDTIPRRDVLVLLLAGETAASDWVRREVDIAKGSRVAVLPVKIRADFDLQATLKKFDITFAQTLSLLKGTEAEFTELREGIDQLYESNRWKRREFLSSLEDSAADVFEPAQEKLCEFKFNDTKIYLAAGDFIQMRGCFDALVNPENDYMQMARIFEAKSISSLLRYYGSYLDPARRIVEDSVQKELDEKLGKLTRPVVQGTVLVTSAGHKESYLRDKMKVRYILHAASVTVQGGGVSKHLEPIRDSGALKDVVRSVLNHARENGDIKRIYVPMFGTGKGGLSVEQVVAPIVGGVKEYLVDAGEQPLKKIHLGVFFKEDVKPLREAMEKEFEVVRSTDGNEAAPE